MSFKLQLGDEYYAIVSPSGKEGDPVPYGEQATVEYGGRIYAALLDVDDESTGEGEVFSVIGAEGAGLVVYELNPVDTQIEDDVEFDVEGELPEGEEGEPEGDYDDPDADEADDGTDDVDDSTGAPDGGPAGEGEQVGTR